MPYSEKDIASGEHSESRLRLLIFGIPKGGKSTSVAKTSPGPIYIINAEKGGLGPAQRLGAKFEFDYCFKYADAKKIVDYLENKCSGSKSLYRTVVIDSITIIAQNLMGELKKQEWRDNRQMYGEFADRLLHEFFYRIVRLPVHIVCIAHAIDVDNEAGSMGVLPQVPGKSAQLIAAGMQDMVWLEMTPGKGSEKTKREFLIGPQGNWKGGCRSIQDTGRIDASVTEFIRRAGIKP